MSKIQNNNTSLEEILEAVNNLPDAGQNSADELYSVKIENKILILSKNN